MKKKLIFVTKALWVGGIETALVNLVGSLDPERYDITCLLLRDEKPMAARLPKTCRLLVSDREHTVSFRKPYRYDRLFHLTETPEHPSGLHRAMMWAVPAIRWVDKMVFVWFMVCVLLFCASFIF